MQPKKLIHWDANGIPRPHTDWLLPKKNIDDVLLASLALPYEGTWNVELQQPVLESEYEGLTNIEVACIKQAKKAAAGDLEALRFTIERLLGKPKQAVEQTTVTMSLKEYLATIDLGEIVETVAHEVKATDKENLTIEEEEFDV
jgi:hypothetical protein